MKPIERRYFIPEGHSSMEPLLLSTSDSEAGLIPKPLATGMPDQSYNEPVGTFENFGFLQSGSDLDKQKYPANGGGLRQSSFTSWPKSRENVPPAVKAAGRTGKFNFRSTEKNGKLTSTSSSSPSSSNERRPFVRNFTEAVRVIQPDFHSESDGLASPLNSGSQTVDSTDVSMSSTAPLTQNQLLRSSHSAGIQNGNFSSESTV